MFCSPTRAGFTNTCRIPIDIGKEKMSAPNNAYYVLTQAHGGLPNSVLFNDVGDARYFMLDASNNPITGNPIINNDEPSLDLWDSNATTDTNATGTFRFYRGAGANFLGQVGFTSFADNAFRVINGTNGPLEFWTNNTLRGYFSSSGDLWLTDDLVLDSDGGKAFFGALQQMSLQHDGDDAILTTTGDFRVTTNISIADNLAVFFGNDRGVDTSIKFDGNDLLIDCNRDIEFTGRRVLFTGDGTQSGLIRFEESIDGVSKMIIGNTDTARTTNQTGFELQVRDSTSARIAFTFRSGLQDINPATRTSRTELFHQTNGISSQMCTIRGDEWSFKGMIGTGNVIPTQPVSSHEKCCMTVIGGFAIKLINETGADSIEGQLVRADTSRNESVKLTGTDEEETMGVFLESGIGDGFRAWVVVSGLANVAMEDNTGATRGNWVRSSITEAGYADATNATPPSPAAFTHFNEIGHCVQTVTAGGIGTHILAKCVLHFN